jgi:nitrite reductase (NO-forming)
VFVDGDLISPPRRGIQVTMIPPGSATCVEIDAIVPGNFTLVDHAIFRMDKGAIGFLKVLGIPRKEILFSTELPENCENCKLHYSRGTP